MVGNLAQGYKSLFGFESATGRSQFHGLNVLHTALIYVKY